MQCFPSAFVVAVGNASAHTSVQIMPIGEITNETQFARWV